MSTCDTASDSRNAASPSSLQISVLTLVRGRQAQLDQFIAALCTQTHAAFELIIASMQATPPTIADDLSFPVRVVTVPGGELPLARARNDAARSARGEMLIFLDVDCIAAPDLVMHYARALAEHDACLMGEVCYLPEGAAAAHRGFEALARCAVRHPARPMFTGPAVHDEPEPRALWGLSFALRRTRFFAAGGLNACYRGYGGEETDFALRLAAIGTRFAWVPQARALHQWHPICRPPLDHFHAIIANARRFHADWGSWCLEYWLTAFADLQLIRWSITDDCIVVRREPSAREIARARATGSARCF